MLSRDGGVLGGALDAQGAFLLRPGASQFTQENKRLLVVMAPGQIEQHGKFLIWGNFL
jgi:hypothetical protein